MKMGLNSRIHSLRSWWLVVRVVISMILSLRLRRPAKGRGSVSAVFVVARCLCRYSSLSSWQVRRMSSRSQQQLSWLSLLVVVEVVVKYVCATSDKVDVYDDADDSVILSFRTPAIFGVSV